MVRNLAFILYVLSHVGAFFYYGQCLKKKKEKKTGTDMFTAVLYIAGRLNQTTLG